MMLTMNLPLELPRTQRLHRDKSPNTGITDGVNNKSAPGATKVLELHVGISVTLASFRPYNICPTRGLNSQPHYDTDHY